MNEFWEREKQSPNPRLINFKNYKFPFIDPIEIYGQSVDDPTQLGSLKLANYAYPAHYDKLNEPNTLLDAFTRREAAPNLNYRGIVFYIHGFSEYVQRFAHLGQKWSNLGYDFYAMDMRGHGRS